MRISVLISAGQLSSVRANIQIHSPQFNNIYLKPDSLFHLRGIIRNILFKKNLFHLNKIR